MKNLDSALLKKFLHFAGEKLSGQWILVGGTLLPAVGIDARATVDIDLIGLGATESAQTLELMTIAESLSLPVDTINQAAAFFLNKVGYRESDLLLLHEGDNAKMFRPSAVLYIKLKSARMTESDFIDCKNYFSFCEKNGDFVDKKIIATTIARALKNSASEEVQARLHDLKRALKI
jgi:hypothetical protein